MIDQISEDNYYLQLIDDASTGLPAAGSEPTKPCGISVFNIKLPIIKHAII